MENLKKKRADAEAALAHSLSGDLAAGSIDVENAIAKHKAWRAEDDVMAAKIRACEEVRTFIEERVDLKTTQSEAGPPAQISSNRKRRKKHG